MFFVWLCWNVVVGDLATGTALGSSMKFRDALIALSIGDIILVAVMIMTVYIGSKTGLAAMSLIRFTFRSPGIESGQIKPPAGTETTVPE